MVCTVKTRTMERSKKAAIIGVGLMGASLALSLKKWTEIEWVIGVDPERKNLELAQERGIIDRGYSQPHSSLEDCGYIFLAPPVDRVVPVFSSLLESLAKETIISDMGSTKREIVSQIQEILPPGISFIGGHPMTGSEKIGPQHADPFLFENAFYVLTPTERTPQEAIDSLTSLIERVGAIVITLDPVRHDHIVAAISHLPQLMATTLINTIFSKDEDPFMCTLAAGGFKDTTRIADSNPRMWEGIFSSNREEILGYIARIREELLQWEEILTRDEGSKIVKKLEEAKKRRKNIPEREKSLLPRFFEVYVAIPDRPRILGRITTLIGEEGINISDIEILKIRERGGALRLGFGTQKDRERALEILRKEGFKVQ